MSAGFFELLSSMVQGQAPIQRAPMQTPSPPVNAMDISDDGAVLKVRITEGGAERWSGRFTGEDRRLQARQTVAEMFPQFDVGQWWQPVQDRRFSETDRLEILRPPDRSPRPLQPREAQLPRKQDVQASSPEQRARVDRTDQARPAPPTAPSPGERATSETPLRATPDPAAMKLRAAESRALPIPGDIARAFEARTGQAKRDTDWLRQRLGEWVGERDSGWRVAGATLADTALGTVDVSMSIAESFADMLKLGEGIAERSWSGAGKDALRAIAWIPVVRALRGVRAVAPAADPGLAAGFRSAGKLQAMMRLRRWRAIREARAAGWGNDPTLFDQPWIKWGVFPEAGKMSLKTGEVWLNTLLTGDQRWAAFRHEVTGHRSFITSNGKLIAQWRRDLEYWAYNNIQIHKYVHEVIAFYRESRDLKLALGAPLVLNYGLTRPVIAAQAIAYLVATGGYGVDVVRQALAKWDQYRAREPLVRARTGP